MTHDGHEWRYVCADIFEQNAMGTEVACKELGYFGGTHTNTTNIVGEEFYTSVDCHGDEEKLADCSRDDSQKTQICNKNEAVLLECYSSILYCPNIDSFTLLWV